MSARLIDDMETLKASMAGRASAYSACGEKELGRRAHRAAFALEDAIPVSYTHLTLPTILLV